MDRLLRDLMRRPLVGALVAVAVVVLMVAGGERGPVQDSATWQLDGQAQPNVQADAAAHDGGSSDGQADGGTRGSSDDESSGGARGSSDRASGAAAALTGARVTRVVDGDTLHADHQGTRWKVRLIGIDTPELSTTRTGSVECGGAEAMRAATELARRWPTVTLQPDPGQDRVDKFGRLLAYVIPDGQPQTTYQQELLRQGWANVYVYGGRPFGRVAAFESARREAERDQVGVWSQCGGNFRQPLHR